MDSTVAAFLGSVRADVCHAHRGGLWRRLSFIREAGKNIPRRRHRATNWRAYDASLRNRGNLTVWFREEALEGWRAQRRKTPRIQVVYSDLAIETALTLRAVFRQSERQREGLIGSTGLTPCSLATPPASGRQIFITKTGDYIEGSGRPLWLDPA